MHSENQNNTPDYKGAGEFILGKLKNELPGKLLYHRLEHTLDVLDAAIKIAAAEKIPEEEKKLLRMAVLFHDSGYMYVYKNHEDEGCRIVKKCLPGFGFTREQINKICAIIMATKDPKHPKSKLDKIIVDADLDYLGRDDVYEIAQKLFDELKIYGRISTTKEWDNFQVNFLKNQHYHTNYSKKNREPKKQQYLNELLKKIQ